MNPWAARYRYKGIAFKSRTEVRRAKQLDALGFHWIYEPRKLVYTDQRGRRRRYIPDFWVVELGRYEEIKYQYTDLDRLKMHHVRAANPRINIVVLTAADLNRPRSPYARRSP